MDLAPRPSLMLVSGAAVVAAASLTFAVAWRRAPLPASACVASRPGLPAVDEARDRGIGKLGGTWHDVASEANFWFGEYPKPIACRRKTIVSNPPWVPASPGVYWVSFHGEWLNDGDSITLRSCDDFVPRAPASSMVAMTYRYRLEGESLLLRDGAGAEVRLVRIDDCASKTSGPQAGAAVGHWRRVSPPKYGSVDWIELRSDGSWEDSREQSAKSRWAWREGVLYQLRDARRCDVAAAEVKGNRLSLRGEEYRLEHEPR